MDLHSIKFDVEDIKKRMDTLEENIRALPFITLEMVERRTDELATEASELSSALLTLLDSLDEDKETEEKPEGILA